MIGGIAAVARCGSPLAALSPTVGVRPWGWGILAAFVVAPYLTGLRVDFYIVLNEANTQDRDDDRRRFGLKPSFDSHNVPDLDALENRIICR